MTCVPCLASMTANHKRGKVGDSEPSTRVTWLHLLGLASGLAFEELALSFFVLTYTHTYIYIYMYIYIYVYIHLERKQKGQAALLGVPIQRCNTRVLRRVAAQKSSFRPRASTVPAGLGPRLSLSPNVRKGCLGMWAIHVCV